MRIKFIQAFCLLLLCSSCKSLQTASSKQNANSTSAKRKGPHFINDIAITPGEQKNSNYHYKKNAQSKKYVSHIAGSSNFKIENANWLQIKYAIMTDMPVEELNDLPLLQQVDKWWGTKYCYGGNSDVCIDCSAFTQTLLRNVYGVDVPRTAKEQYDFSTHIKDDDLKEGDLVFFQSGRDISHVGLYIANNKFVHASTSGGVMISDLNDDYWNKRYAGAGRVIN